MGLEFVIELEEDIGLSADIYPTIIFRAYKIFEPIALEKVLLPFEIFQRDDPDRLLDLFRAPYLPGGVVWSDAVMARIEKYLSRGQTDWFDAADGLETIRGYLNYQRENENDTVRFIRALELIESVLAEAERRGVRFYITTTHEQWLKAQGLTLADW